LLKGKSLIDVRTVVIAATVFRDEASIAAPRLRCLTELTAMACGKFTIDAPTRTVEANDLGERRTANQSGPEYPEHRATGVG
jgi:hypothetical protein